LLTKSCRPFRQVAALIAAALCAASSSVAGAEELPLFRLFLLDGPVVACLGEYARLDAHVVCSLPLNGVERTELVRLRADQVDWARTDRYAAALRAARYAESRGEYDFAALSNEVAQLLNEVAQTPDNARRLGIALEARRRLAEWPARHHDYRAGDVQQILQLVDDAVADFRAAAGAQQFDLALHAVVPPPPTPALLAPPTPEEAVAAAIAVAERSGNATERVSLLEAIARTLGQLDGKMSSASFRRLSSAVDARLEEDRATDASYTKLMRQVTGRARRAAAAADVRGVERALAMVGDRDRRLGRRRPDRIAAILATIQHDLDAARRLRLARDQWAVKAVTFRSYRRAVRAPLEQLSLMARGLDDIKRLAGPAAPALSTLTARATAAVRGLGIVVPPTDLAPVHSLMISAAQLASQAVAVRRDAVASGMMERAWQASSAAAGSLMLLERARAELDRALTPPVL
jgi:hypothetical protein